VLTLWRDLKFGFRMLAKDPSFTAVAMLTLCLGIGANTAIFQLLDAVRLQKLPVRDPQQLAVIQFPEMSTARGSQMTPYPSLTKSDLGVAPGPQKVIFRFVRLGRARF
jgi:hypothetical protein